MRIVQSKQKDKQNSFFYEGTIAEIKTKKTIFKLIATGNIRIESKNGIVWDNNGERNEGIKGGINTDKDLKKIGNEFSNKYRWENNNWFEVIFKENNSETYDSVMGDVAYTYNDGINLLKQYAKEGLRT